jgi:hypothetical protein
MAEINSMVARLRQKCRWQGTLHTGDALLVVISQATARVLQDKS